MYMCRTESVARQIAQEKKQAYGYSLFDGRFYVGPAVELKKIGVVDPQIPSNP